MALPHRDLSHHHHCGSRGRSGFLQCGSFVSAEPLQQGVLTAPCSPRSLARVSVSTCDSRGDALQSLGEAVTAVDIHNSNLEIECLYLSRPYYLLWFNLQNNMA